MLFSIQFRLFLSIITTGFLLVYFGLVRQYIHITLFQAIYAIIIIILGILPGLFYFLFNREKDLIPLLPLNGIFYSLAFGIPTISDKTDWLGGSEADITNALLLTLLGLLSLYSGYYSFRKCFNNLKPLRSPNVPLPNQIKTAWILYFFFLSFYIFPSLKSLPSIEQLATPLGYISLGILTLLFFNGKLSRFHSILFWMAFLLTLVIYTLSGSLAPAVLLLIYVGILYWNIRKVLPWRIIFVLISLTIILNPVKLDYREVTWYTGRTDLTIYEKANLLSETVLKYYSTSGLVQSIVEDTSTINRIAHISTFSKVVSMTPEVVPYWLGDSYSTLWTSFIPRALWPGKPHSTIGQDFGHRYEFIAPDDLWTSINLPWIIEFYANFGSFGVAVGMFTVGIFFRILVQKFRAPANLPIEHALSVSVMFGLFYAESNFALMVGGILSTYISLVLLIIILGKTVYPMYNKYRP